VAPAGAAGGRRVAGGQGARARRVSAAAGGRLHGGLRGSGPGREGQILPFNVRVSVQVLKPDEPLR